MEGVGARFGRSSSRYGPAPVFTGPVRKWRKKWIHVLPSNSTHNLHAATNGTVNGTNGSSRLSLFKWAPSDSGNDKPDSRKSGDDCGLAVVVTPKRKFKYIPVIALEDQRNDSSEQTEDESKLMETGGFPLELNSNSNNGEFGEKPDINDVPVDERHSVEMNYTERQDLNVDLSLG